MSEFPPDYVPITPSDMQPYMTTNEGYSRTEYPDSQGIPTVGIGHNLPAGGQAAIESLAGNPSYNDVLAGRLALTDSQVAELFANDMSKALSDARAVFPSFDFLPSPAQMALGDMAFNLGQGRLGRFVALQQAVANEDWAASVNAMAISAWSNQVGDRAGRDEFLMYMPQLTKDIADQVRDIVEQAPNFEILDAADPERSEPGDFPFFDGTMVVADLETGPGQSEVSPSSYGSEGGYQEGPGWDGGELGDPASGPGTAGDGYSGGGSQDGSPAMGDYESAGDGAEYGPDGYGDGGFGEGGSFGGGQAGDGESGGQFGGGDGGYDGEGGFGGYGGDEGDGGDGGEGD